MSIWQEIQPMRRVKKKYQECRINGDIINEISENLKNGIQELTLPFLIKDLQRVISNAIPKKILRSRYKKKAFENIIFKDSKRFLKSTVEKTSNSLHEFVINQVIGALNKYLKNIRKRSINVNMTEILCDLFDDLSVGSYEASDSLIQSIDISRDEEPIEDKTWPKKYDFYFKVKPWWDEHGHKENTTLLWWKHFGNDWKWHGKTLEAIDIPLVPGGFTLEFIYGNDVTLAFRCDDCGEQVHFTKLYTILLMREHVDYLESADLFNIFVTRCQDDPSDDCCLVLSQFPVDEIDDELTFFDTKSSSIFDSQEDEDEDFITQHFSSESGSSCDSVQKRFLVNLEKYCTPSEEEVTPPVRHTLKYDEDSDLSDEFDQKFSNKKQWERNQKK
jgi:hypothetical protein